MQRSFEREIKMTKPPTLDQTDADDFIRLKFKAECRNLTDREVRLAIGALRDELEHRKVVRERGRS